MRVDNWDTKLSNYITKKSNEKRVNWQMLACYLDGKIFE